MGIKKEIKEMTNAQVDKVVKIVGTNHDRRRVITNQKVANMKKSLNAGKSVEQVAKKYKVSEYVVKYNTDPSFNASEKIRKTQYKYPTTVTATEAAAIVDERGAYKRMLVETRKIR